jgi:ubiquinone/menaquinone biosynthesis C-methylase UbiE
MGLKVGSKRAQIDRTATQQTRARYSRIAPVYDLLEAPVERFFLERFRRRLFAHVSAGKILEIGVGTGKNFPFYPEAAAVTAIDISPAMLERGHRRSGTLRVTFREMDAQALDFPEQVFDVVLATFVFCSVPDPVLGLREARRVCKPAGRLLLLEHVRPGGRFLGPVFDCFNPLVRSLLGPEINRQTVRNAEKAGWNVVRVENLLSDVVKLVIAVP